MTMKTVSTLASAALCASTLSAGSFLNQGDKWILSGDSITSTDIYRQILQLSVDHYHPDSGIIIGNRGVWGQKLSEEKRLEAKDKPQIVSIMIAMNSFIHHEYGTRADFSQTVKAHIEGLRPKIRDYKAKGAVVMLMTPTRTDERESSYFVTFNSRRGLVEVGEAIRQLANEEGCFLIPVAEEIDDYVEEMGPYETFIPDGVHPYGYGQYVIANSFMKRMNFAGELGGGRHLSERGVVAPLPFSCKTKFMNNPEDGLTFSTDGIKGHIRWSVWCDSLRVMTDNDCAGHCMARGEGELTGEAEWKLPAPVEAHKMVPGERARIMIDIVPEDGISRLFCVDLATTKIIHMKDGHASGEVVTDLPRSEGPKVCSWEIHEDGPDLWLTGMTTADSWNYKPYGTWANPFNMNGLQILFDFRPGDRFAGINPDRDAPMILMSVIDNPHFAVMPLSWLSRRYQPALFADAKKCEGGWNWTLGFRGNITDCEPFDIRKLECFGMHMLVADEENGKVIRYTSDPYSPLDNPERRMHQTTIFDRVGKFPGDTTTTVNFYAFK